MANGWDNATLKKLKSLATRGLSTAEIGKKLGMSKNAIVGKLNRLGWNLKAGGIPLAGEDAVSKTPKVVKAAPVVKKAKPAPAPKVIVKKPIKKEVSVAKPAVVINKKIEKPVVKAVKPESKPASNSKKNMSMHQRIVQHSLAMANLKPDQCRYPIGDPDTESFRFCGEKVFAGKPYCYDHCKDAYQFTPPKKK